MKRPSANMANSAHTDQTSIETKGRRTARERGAAKTALKAVMKRGRHRFDSDHRQKISRVIRSLESLTEALYQEEIFRLLYAQRHPRRKPLLDIMILLDAFRIDHSQSLASTWARLIKSIGFFDELHAQSATADLANDDRVTLRRLIESNNQCANSGVGVGDLPAALDFNPLIETELRMASSIMLHQLSHAANNGRDRVQALEEDDVVGFILPDLSIRAEVIVNLMWKIRVTMQDAAIEWAETKSGNQKPEALGHLLDDPDEVRALAHARQRRLSASDE